MIGTSQVRLFEPDEAGGETVSALWRELWLAEHFPQDDPEKKPDRAPATKREYVAHLANWKGFWASGGTPYWSQPRRAADMQSATQIPPWLPEPAAGDVRSADLSAFRSFLRECVPGGDRARNKHVQSILAVLRAAQQAERITAVPCARAVPTKKSAPRLYLKPAEIDALYTACAAATWPTHSKSKTRRLPRGPAGQWRAALCEFVCFGFRTQELISYESDHEPLRWKNVLLGAGETPDPTGTAVAPFGWLWYVPQKQQRKKPEPLYLPIPELAAAHFASIRPHDWRPEDPVFPWPRCGRDFYAAWKQILAAAGVRPKEAAQVPAYQLKHLRKTCATRCDNHRAGLASLVLGHAPRGDQEGAAVTRRHYSHPEEQLVEGLLSLPAPASFDAIRAAVETPSDPQRWLF